MSSLSATASETHTQRYEALLRAANLIAACSDCDTAAETLLKVLSDVVSFDYLQLVAIENETNTVTWCVLYANGSRKDDSEMDTFLEGTSTGWVHESQQLLVTPDWSQEGRFPIQRQFLTHLGTRVHLHTAIDERRSPARRTEFWQFVPARLSGR